MSRPRGRAQLGATLLAGAALSCARPQPVQGSRDGAAPVTAAPAAVEDPSKQPSDGAHWIPPGLTITSTAFKTGASIPTKHTCEGADTSFPLAIAGVPPGTESLALIMDNPDAPDPAAPKRVWVHWVAYDLPANTRELAEGAGNGKAPGRLGKNDWGSTGYRGPCPPIGRHRFYVKVLALDVKLGDLHEPTKAELLRATKGHELASGGLMGRYTKRQ